MLSSPSCLFEHLFYKSTKSFQDKGRGLQLVIYDTGIILEESLRKISSKSHLRNSKAKAYSRRNMPFHKCFHTTSGRSERLCPNTSCSSCSFFVLKLAFHKNTATQQEAIPAGLPFSSASVGSPSWPFSGPSLLDQMVPSMKMKHTVSSCCTENSKNICMFKFSCR